jgi:cell division protein ZapA (FtsZ GTPase activity inhibitor)
VTLKVAGQVITLRTDQSEAYMHSLADEVNALLDGLRSAAPGTGLPQLMALATLQLADRAVCAEQAVQQSNLKIEHHIERLNNILNSLDA